MKRCGRCKRTLPLDAFGTYYRKDRGKTYTRSYCRECETAYYQSWSDTHRNTHKKASRYAYEELRYRPIEQIMESLTLVDLADALGINEHTAGKLVRDPTAYVDTALELDDAKVRRIREWLESRCTL